MVEVKVKKQFQFMPSWAWAIGIDLTDLAVGWIPVAGEVWDLVQLGAALAVFESIDVPLIGASDLLLPTVADLVPTYTLGWAVVNQRK